MILARYVATFFISFLSGVLFIAIFRKPCLRYKILSRNQIPLIGGLTIYLSFVISCLYGFCVSGYFPQEMAKILFVALAILVFGIVDDLRELSVPTQFLFQLACAGLLVFLGIRSRIAHIGDFANISITLIWVIGITNAFNHIDIMDGLAAASAIIISLAFLIISFLNRNYQAQITCLALTGGVLSFLIYNLAPARIYMGNAGSHFLGFLLAAVSLTIHCAYSGRIIALFSPVLILWFLIFDTAFLIFVRLRNKKLPFNKSNDHLVLRFLAAGYTKKKAFFIMLMLCVFFAGCGILLSRLPDTYNIVIIALVILISLTVGQRMSKVTVVDA